MPRHESVGPFFCSLCWINFTSKTALKKHISDKHDSKDSKKFICHICGQTFTEKRYLKVHLPRHFSFLDFKKVEPLFEKKSTKKRCSNEPEWFENFEISEEIIKNETIETESNDVVLDENLHKLWWEMSESILQIIPPPLKQATFTNFKCKKCSNNFDEISKAERHFNSCFHKPEFLCDICGLLQHSKPELKHHKIRYHGVILLNCSFCQEEFFEIQPLLIHLRQNHEFNRLLLCETCGKISRNKKALNRHLKIHNVKKQIFKCSICLKEFSSRDSLRKHSKTHLRSLKK